MNSTGHKTIALFLDASAIGGIERHVTHLASALQSGNMTVHIILWKDHGNNDLMQELESSGASLHFADGRLFELLGILKNKRIEILHSHGYKANILSRIVNLFTSIRVISTHHNGDMGEGRVRLYTMLDSYSARFSENWSVSREIQKRLPVRSRLMPNFVPLARSIAASEEITKDVVFAGRLVNEKRPDRILEIARQCSDVHFRVYGDGPLFHELEAKKPDNVTLFGFETNADVIWKNAAFCLICSDQEGLPYVALEAMSRGIPVVSTSVGQLPLLIEPGINGWLVNSDKDFATTIQSWFKKSNEQKYSVQQQAQKCIEQKYSVNACLPEYLQAYQ